MNEVFVDAVADTLAEWEVEKQGDTLADLKADALLSALSDTVAEIEA